ncbi:MAG: hypothetical protein JW845_02130 [Dehalococcoidales bacterium]|nr:hypothetical protein [Dehalococcoidales bacterium]
MLEIIDTFPAFLKYWKKAQNQSLDEQIEGWEKVYMTPWPELLAKQLDNYEADKLDWRKIARVKVFPHFSKQIPAMREAHKNLLESCVPLYERVQHLFDFNSDVIVVIYVGIGCGAGWVTPYRDTPAILFGLENIAECDWSNVSDIQELIAHEAGHLVHQYWRSQNGKSAGSGPWWQLYEEGFAQRIESKICSEYTWHQADELMDSDWLEWCQRHKGWLAAEFLKRIGEAKSVAPFFGSWFNINGKIETGYFLGHEVITELEKNISIKEIALFDDIEGYLKPILKQMMP